VVAVKCRVGEIAQLEWQNMWKFSFSAGRHAVPVELLNPRQNGGFAEGKVIKRGGRVARVVVVCVN